MNAFQIGLGDARGINKTTARAVQVKVSCICLLRILLMAIRALALAGEEGGGGVAPPDLLLPAVPGCPRSEGGPEA